MYRILTQTVTVVIFVCAGAHQNLPGTSDIAQLDEPFPSSVTYGEAANSETGSKRNQTSTNSTNDSKLLTPSQSAFYSDILSMIHIGKPSFANPIPVPQKDLQQFKFAMEIIQAVSNTQQSCFVSAPVMKNIEMDQIMGNWYMPFIKRYVPNGKFCQHIHFSKTGTNTFNKTIKIYYQDRIETIIGAGTFIHPGIMIYNWMWKNQAMSTGQSISVILGTDYENYLLSYVCKGNQTTPRFELLTRETVPANGSLWVPYQILERNKLAAPEDLICADKPSYVQSYEKGSSPLSRTQQILLDYANIFHASSQ